MKRYVLIAPLVAMVVFLVIAFILAMAGNAEPHGRDLKRWLDRPPPTYSISEAP